MTPKDGYGKSEFAPTNILPEITVDFTDGEPTVYGHSDTPVTIHQPMAVDFTGESVGPALRLTLRLRPTATAAEVAMDVVRLYSALNEYELSHGGSGLKWNESLGGPVSHEGKVTMTFVLHSPEDAARRIGDLVKMINERDGVLIPGSGVIEACEASFVQAA